MSRKGSFHLQIISIGEILWDVFPKGETLVGAPLNFSATAQRLGNSVALLTAVGADVRGMQAIERMHDLGLSTDLVQIVPNAATGTAIVSVDESGNANYAIQRPAAFDCLISDDVLFLRIESLHPDWIYFGTLAQTHPPNELLLYRLVQRLPGIQYFYDMNLRAGHWNPALIQRLSGLATVLKLNESEAETLFQLTCSSEKFSLERFCRHWSSAYGSKIICITLGSKGCAIFSNNTIKLFAGFTVDVVDTVGAGDTFAAAFLHGLHQDWSTERTALFANALGSLVASRAGATPQWTIDEVFQMMIAERLS